MHICFLVEGYPTADEPIMTFFRELAAKLAKNGVRCSVIAPQSVTRAITHRVKLRKRFWQDEADADHRVDVYQPLYVSFSNQKFLSKLGKAGFASAAKRAYKSIKDRPDALYGHFWHMGVEASKLDAALPVFVACGESKISVKARYTEEEIMSLKKRLCGVIYVGTKSYEEAKSLGLQENEECIIAPNGYDPAVFYPRSRTECRRKLHLSEEDVIVSFVGSFNTRKGVERLSEALRMVNEKAAVKSFFIGSGALSPDCPGILYKGKLAHDAIPEYLCASDMFVLPTNNEGCCNAIVEALACGLPVISSNQLFNADILDESCSVKLDPMDVPAIKEAILRLCGEKVRQGLSEGALRKAASLDIGTRCERILDFMKRRLGSVDTTS